MRTSLSLLLVSIVMSLGSVASLSAAQISLNVAPHSTGNVSYVSGGQLINFAVYNHHPSLNQFVPYSNTSGTPYSCNPLSWLSYMPVPLGQPLMRSNTQR